MGMTDAIVEKDFWVCYMLDYLFHRCFWKDKFAFKGGTSLSKAYDLIERFSEDIDLILDWRVLGYGINEPWEQRSNTKQDAFNKEANARAEAFLRDTFLPAIAADLTAELGDNIHCLIDDDDPQTVKIIYIPTVFPINLSFRKFALKSAHWPLGLRLNTRRLHPMSPNNMPDFLNSLQPKF